MAMNEIRRFHHDIYFEPTAYTDIQRFFDIFGPIVYTHHAKLQTLEDRYGRLPILTRNQLTLDNVFEYYRDGLAISKVVLRITTLSPTLDYCYSISPDGQVITAWANSKEDTHKTLDASLYQARRVA